MYILSIFIYNKPRTSEYLKIVKNGNNTLALAIQEAIEYWGRLFIMIMIIRKWITKSIVDQVKNKDASIFRRNVWSTTHTYLAMFYYFSVITESGLVWLAVDNFGKIEQEKREKKLLLKRVI